MFSKPFHLFHTYKYSTSLLTYFIFSFLPFRSFLSFSSSLLLYSHHSLPLPPFLCRVISSHLHYHPPFAIQHLTLALRGGGWETGGRICPVSSDNGSLWRW